MKPRFYSPAASAAGPLELSAEESHHLTKVLRMRVGDSATVFNGEGLQFSATVAEIGKRAAVVELGPPETAPKTPSYSLTIAVATPKGDRQRWMLEKATELGATDLIPLTTRRSVVQPKSVSDKWRKAVIEACKQCGRNRLPTIHPPQAWSPTLVGAHSTATEPAHRLIAHPSAAITLADWIAEVAPWPHAVIAAVGPEGGFTDEEVEDAVQSGWTPVTLGPRILRIDTAALAVVAMLAFAMERSAGGA